MKNITSKRLRDVYESLPFPIVVIDLIRRVVESDFLSIIGTILGILFFITFIAALVKGWFETRSVKQVYKDNKFWIISLLILYTLAIIIMLR